jgi:iron complex outermembrane receptor protein
MDIKDAWVIDEWTSTYGSVKIADGNTQFVFPNSATMRNWKNTMSKTATGQPANGFSPICSNMGSRSGEVPGTCFRPNEALNVTEVSDAFYVQVDFGGEDLTLFDRPISGNIGARYIETEITSVGGEQFPEYNVNDRPCEDTVAKDPNAPPPPVPKTVTCYLHNDDIAFMNNGGNLGTSKATHHNLLPSLNIKYDVTNKFVTRFALSRAMSRPDIGSLRNYVEVRSNLPNVDDANGSLWVKDGTGKITGANVAYTAHASNPFLKPTIADQADVSFEYYSGPNSASFAVFAKSFDDYIQTGTYLRKMTNNGITRDVAVTGPVNGDGAKVQGFEVQGTHLFDYLPGIWSGLGVQANYTYVDNKGIKNTGINSGSQDGLSSSAGASDRVQVDKLEGMSKDAYNFSVFYERNKFSTRLAYSWRSEYLVTVQDCCIGTPVWQDAYGQLDASVRYRINDMFELSLSGSNLTDQKATLRQQVQNSEDGGKTLKYSINQSDVRYNLGLRMQF